MVSINIRRIEGVFGGVGLVLLAIWFTARVHGAIGSRKAIARFEALRERNSSGATSTSRDPVLGLPIDLRLWSTKRVAAYKDSLDKKTDIPLAILQIPKIGLEVPVFNGTDDLTLNRGVGRILGTAQIGKSGNLGIAGHRDGFFRGLQNIAAGDVITIARLGHIDRYVASGVRIVTPDDVSVLKRTAAPTLTLVTCFPFYFVGHAPKRYIVTALFAGSRKSGFDADEDKVFAGTNTKN